jgi:DNA-binding NarL/FixJ family response regulator
MNASHLIRVLVIDDQELIRTGLRGILRRRDGFEIVGERESGTDIVAVTDRMSPDVVIMDIRMPGVDGVTATRTLREHGATPILVLTTFDDDEILAGALRAGASGFLLKGVPAEDLQRAVRTIAEGGAWLDPAVTARVLSDFREGLIPVRPGHQVERLTPREREVLALIGAGLSNTEIAAELFLGDGTVKTHVGHIFAKLDLRDRAAAVIFVFDHGLVRPGDPRRGGSSRGGSAVVEFRVAAQRSAVGFRSRLSPR